jgi:uncharacterized protein DUF4214/List-Bact-rpt repeat protein
MRTGGIAVILCAAVGLLLGTPAGARVRQGSFPQLIVKVHGQGHVTSDDEGIDCPPDCQESNEGTFTVTLTETPDPGWKFAGWDGACHGHNEHCTVFVDERTSVDATFIPESARPNPSNPTTEVPPITFGLTVTVVGVGSVASAPSGIDCGGDCSETYPEHQTVSLSPFPAADFVGWSGDCSGTGGCTVVMDGPHHVTATFSPHQVPPDEIGPTKDPINDPGKAGEESTLTLVFDCFSTQELWLDEVYVLLLHRELDQGSRDAFFPRFTAGLSLTQAALDVLHSAEYRTLLIQGFYNTFLHRSASPTELAFWLAALAGGATDEDVMAAILGSAEYFATRGGGTNAGFIAALYQDLLGRPPSAAEQAQWDAAFGAGASRQDAAMQVLKSTEFRTRLIKGWFQAYLGRAPTDVELNFYLGRFAAGDTDEMIQAAILGSSEFSGKVGDYDATINWGDGTSTKGTVKHTTNGGRDCEVTGQHTFPNPGDIPVNVLVMDPDGHSDAFRGLMRIRLQLPPPGQESVQPFGTVLINVNGKFVPLAKLTDVKLGTELDTTHGRVRLTSPDGSNGQFYEGRFKIQRDFIVVRGKKVPITLLLLTGPLPDCKARTTSGVFAAPPRPGKKVVRHLWGNVKGKFRTRGKYASATVTGTQWETLDYCDGTLVFVQNGRVDVLDLVKNQHHFVTGGHSFFAQAP